jgi:hypothetical protein
VERIRGKRPDHLVRLGWNQAFFFKWPEDINLAISKEVDTNKMPSQFQEIFARFLNLGFIREYGNQCVLMSSVLRRVLRLHGFEAYARQYVLYWEKPDKGQELHIGGFDNMAETGEIDAHMAVAVGGYILDFSARPIMERFGATAPQAFIAVDDAKFNNDYQDFGLHGQACWTPARPLNPIIKHWRYNQKDLELDLSKEYFAKYQF